MVIGEQGQLALSEALTNANRPGLIDLLHHWQRLIYGVIPNFCESSPKLHFSMDISLSYVNKNID